MSEQQTTSNLVGAHLVTCLPSRVLRSQHLGRPPVLSHRVTHNVGDYFVEPGRYAEMRLADLLKCDLMFSGPRILQDIVGFLLYKWGHVCDAYRGLR